MATATVVKTTAPDGSAASAPQTVEVNRKVQLVRTTDGNLIEVPFNRFSLFDTQALAQTMTFFPPNPNGDTLENNYDQMPPNAAQPTIITKLGIRAMSQSVRSYAGGGTAQNAINPGQIADLLAAAMFYVEKGGNRERVVEEPLARYFDLDRVDVRIDGDNSVLTLPSRPTPAVLDEVIHIPAGVNYKMRIVLPSATGIPIAAGYAAAGVRPIKLQVRAEHRGDR